MQPLSFRGEIEGLRGVLMLAIALYHAGISYFEAAFFSLDVFFLVSGYLMAAIILSDLQTGRFSLGQFYERRARRLLPALYVVLLATALAAYYFMPPADYERMAESGMAVLLMYSNAYFAGNGPGYFSADIGMQPLMHLWSISVEQQYYLLIPLLILLVWSLWRRAIVPVLVGLALVSFAFAYAGARQGEASTYYLLSARAWEFLLGSLFAIHEGRMRAWVPRLAWRWLADAGGLMILISLFLVSEHSLHPGPVTLLPLLGGGLLLVFSVPESYAARLLHLRPLMLLGAISYSLYLWHQVVLAFGRWHLLSGVQALEALALIALAVGLSVLTYRWVEVPFRNRRRIASGRFWGATMGATLLLYQGVQYVDKQDGFPGRLPVAAVEQATNAMSLKHFAVTEDGRRCTDFLNTGRPCEIGDPATGRNWAIIGDSHAVQLISSLDSALRAAEIGGYAVASSGCGIGEGLRMVGDHTGKCVAYNVWLRQWLSENDISDVIVAGRWAYYYDRGPYRNGRGGTEAGKQYWYEPERPVAADDYETAVIQAMLAPVRRLIEEGRRVILVFPIPEFAWDVPRYYLQQFMAGRDSVDISIEAAVYWQRNERFRQVAQELAAAGDLTIVDPAQTFCEEGRCFAYRDGRILYRDDDHLTRVGADQLVGDIMASVGFSFVSDRIVSGF